MASSLVFLGTGTPNPDPRRQGPCMALIAGEQVYLFDCGVGLVRGAVAASEQGVPELTIESLKRVFITHLHSDHTVGLPDLLFTPAVTGRRSALEVFGSPGTQAMVTHVRAAWDEDVEIRLLGAEPSVSSAYEVNVREWQEGESYSDENVCVIPFAVSHGAWKHALGYRVETREGVVVLSGDTVPSDNLAKFAEGCEVLIHEAYSALGLSKRTPEWQAYHSSYHTSGVELGKLAVRVNPKLLLINHLLPFGESEEQVLDEVRKSFSGEARIAVDLERVDL